VVGKVKKLNEIRTAPESRWSGCWNDLKKLLSRIPETKIINFDNKSRWRSFFFEVFMVRIRLYTFKPCKGRNRCTRHWLSNLCLAVKRWWVFILHLVY